MANDTESRPIVVKRKKVINGGSHGGAWKIAYADFVTAMMAFFLLMWLLGSVDGTTRGGIAEYFKTPLKVSLSGNGSLGESAIILHGGGKDLTMTTGQSTNKSPAASSKILELKNTQESVAREEMIKMHGMKSKLDTLIKSDVKLQPYGKQLLIDVTTEGLRIQIVDESNRPMFALSSAELESRARDILRELVPTLNVMPNKISLSGHTDAKPFAQGSKVYSNWELSSDRAHDARRVLVDAVMDESKLMRVIGLSSSVLLDEKDPLNPINRRISIILLNKRAEQSAASEGQRQIAPPLDQFLPESK